MAETKIVSKLADLQQYVNDKGYAEIIVREKGKNIKKYYNIVLDNLQETEVKEKIEESIKLLNKNNELAETSLNVLSNVAKLNKFNLVLNGLNLCATCAGFAIMCAKLDKMGAQINEIVALHKSTEGVHVNYEFNKVLSEHSNMLDCRKTQNYYSAEQMRELVSQEYNVLEFLIEAFMSDISNNQETLIFSMLSLASMLAVSLKYFDEAYYFKNKETIGDGDVWHMDHNRWVSIFDKMSSSEFIEKIQDYGIFEMGLNTVENDCFYIGFYDQVKSLKQEIEDNQKLIVSVDDPEILKMVVEKISEEIRSEIENTFIAIGVDKSLCEDALRIALT